MTLSCESSDPHLWSVAEYHQLIKDHVIGVQAPTELVAGRIIQPDWQPKTAHQAVVQRLRFGFQKELHGQALVRSQQPVLLGVDSEPKPDIAIVLGTDARYQHHRPTPVEIALIVEVTEGSLVLDGYLKAIEYAEAGIPDYWVFDLSRQQLYVFRDICNGAYHPPRVLRTGDCIRPLAFPELTVTLCNPVQRHGLTRYKRHPHWQNAPLSPPILIKRQKTASFQQFADASKQLTEVSH